MKKMMMAMVSLMMVSGWAGMVSAEQAEPCDEINALRLDGQLEAAEEAGRTCVEARPDDMDKQLELARVIYAQGDLEEALQWARGVVDEAPDNHEAQLFKARLQGHGGEYAPALERLDELPEAVREGQEARRLRADLLLWSGDHGAAVTAYEGYLEEHPDDGSAWTNLGHARMEAGGSVSLAVEAYEQSCQRGEQAGCLAAQGIAEALGSRYFVRLEPGYTAVFDGPDGHHLRVTGGIDGPTYIEVGYHQIARGIEGADTLRDHGVTAEVGQMLSASTRVGAGVGAHFRPDFSPNWTAYLEGTRSFDAGLVSGLRLWRMHFSNGGANIINPSLTYYRGPFELDGRYFLSIDDDGEVDHSAMGRVSYYFNDHASVRAGFGAGTSPEFVDVATMDQTPTLSQYTALLGGGLELRGAHRLDLDLRYRHEGRLGPDALNGSDGRYQALDVVLGYRVSF